MNSMKAAIFLCTVVLVLSFSWRASGGDLVKEDFHFTSSFDGTTPLYAAAIYEKKPEKLVSKHLS